MPFDHIASVLHLQTRCDNIAGMLPRTSRRARSAVVATQVVGARFTESEVAALDREVDRLRAKSPEAGHASRSSVLRGLVAKHLLPRRRRAGKAKRATA